MAVTAAGGTLLAWGLRRRSFTGYAGALAGGWMLYRGLKGGDGRDFELASLEAAEAAAEAVDVERTLTIQASPDEVRAFLSEAGNLDHVLGEAGTVEQVSDTEQRWRLNSPLGQALSWTMRREDPGTSDELHWTSEGTGEAEIEMNIGLAPAPGDRGTEVTMALGFHPPGGAVGKALFERLDVVPHALVGRMLRRTKAIVETGEAPTLSGSPSARDRPASSGV